MKYQFHSHFIKSYKKLSAKLKSAVDSRLLLFSKDPFLPELHNHSLIGKYKGYRSINITGDYRALYKEIAEDEVIFVLLGTHAQLYK